MGDHGTSASGWIVWIIALCCIFLYGLYHELREKRQTAEVRAFADVLGFIEATLPSDLPITSLAPKLAEPNLVLVGTYNKCRAVIAKAKVGQGKGSYEQSFVAVELPDSTPYMPPAFLSSLQFEYYQQDRWVLGTIHKQTMDADAVKGFLQCFT